MLRWAMQSASAHEAAKKAGKVIVELEPPELLPGLGGWYEDFLELSTNRQIGMGLGDIPAWCIDAHVRGWPHDEADMFRACMRAMDRVYLARVNGTGDGGGATDTPEANPNAARDAFRAAFRKG